MDNVTREAVEMLEHMARRCYELSYHERGAILVVLAALEAAQEDVRHYKAEADFHRVERYLGLVDGY